MKFSTLVLMTLVGIGCVLAQDSPTHEPTHEPTTEPTHELDMNSSSSPSAELPVRKRVLAEDSPTHEPTHEPTAEPTHEFEMDSSASPSAEPPVGDGRKRALRADFDDIYV